MSAIVPPRATARPARRTGTKWANRLRLLLRYTLLLGIFVFAVFPFLWTIAISITDKAALQGMGIYDFPGSLFPKKVTLANFAQVFEQFSLGKYVMNSVIISGLTVLGTVFVSALAAYPLARFNFPLKNVLFAAIIATLVLPSETNFIVNMLTLQKLGWVGTHTGVIVPTLASAFGIFLMRQAFLTIPQSLLEAARLDGANEWTVLWRIMLPLSLPSVATLAIFTLVTSWNTYFWPYIVLGTRPDLAPLSVAVLKLKGQFNYDPFNIAAGNLIMMLPILLVFLLAQRSFMRGIEGALK